jgi:3-methyladenine DNA glycosylase AlkD
MRKATTTLDPYLLPLLALFQKNQEVGRAAAMSKYLRDQFVFYGLPTPLRRQLISAFFKEQGYPETNQLIQIVNAAYLQPEREWHYFALELLIKMRKNLRPTDLPFLKTLILQHSWWDTIDTIAPKLVGFLVEKNRDLFTTMDEWATDSNFWIRRSAILCQLKWKEKTDFHRLTNYCIQNADSKEFFIQKAMGWALREYAYVEPQLVSTFITTHPHLPKLTIREASKHL